MIDMVDAGSEAGRIETKEIETEICALAGRIAAASAQYLILVGEFDARRGWAGWEVRSCAHWLSWRAGVDLHTAREQVRVAKAMRELPLITSAYLSGTISYSKVRAMTRVATAENEASLLQKALDAPAAHIERLCRGLKKAMRPTKGNGVDLDPCAGRWRWDEDDGSLVLTARFRPEDGKRFLAALTRAEYERTRTDGESEGDRAAPAPPNPVPAMIAMAEMVCAAMDSPVVSPAAEVLVHIGGVDEAGSDHAHFDDGPGLDDETLAQVLCSAVMRTVGHGRLGRTVRWSSTAKVPSRTQLRQLIIRDRCCTVPGCGRTRFLHAHHVTYRSRGGATSLDNLVLLCGEHHRALHDGYFFIEALGDQRFSFRHPSGTEIIHAPAMSGDADEVRRQYSGIAPDAIVPDWGGEGLDLSYATDVLITNWQRAA
ncbi:HNH endonuclease signature motif containing protein [Rhodococcus sp. B7740]|uniref:HNH endonuclease signature motif containing protein n=1 Tax=Rhodococcus sp. B7740 TaxID=1564114 RepID=UPI000AC33A9D|nr:HNH endonuclease signature motif containing protein [Rhodococcus sp. B7740]